MHMNAAAIEVYVSASIAFALLAICFAALLRRSVRENEAASHALMSKGNQALGISSTVSTLNARYLLPVGFPKSITTQGISVFTSGLLEFALGARASVILLAALNIGVA